MQIFITILAAVFVFAIVIFIHELGHFVFAKLFGVRVNEFAIGMGPKIIKKQGKQTLYSVRAVPFGGFCAMEGEDENSDDPNALNHKPVWQRVIIVCAGAVFNVILGFILYLIILGVNPTTTVPVVDGFTEQSQAQAAGMMEGDRIVKLDDTSVHIYNDVLFFMQRADGSPIDVTVERNGEKVVVPVTPVKVEESYEYFEDKVVYTMKQNGFQVDSQTITEGIEAYREKAGTKETSSRYLLGFTPEKHDRSLGGLLYEAFYNTIFICKVVYVSVFELVTGQLPLSQLSGPVGIISGISEAAQTGFLTLLNFLAMITINLGIFNLLPIPALDGGRLVFLIVEAIRRKPVPPEREGLVHMIGFAVLILFIIVVSFSDIMKLFA